MESVGVDCRRGVDSDGGEVALSDEFFMGGAYDEGVEKGERFAGESLRGSRDPQNPCLRIRLKNATPRRALDRVMRLIHDNEIRPKAIQSFRESEHASDVHVLSVFPRITGGNETMCASLIG
jgi:hypothetical protein